MLVAFPVEPDPDVSDPDEEVDPVLKPYSELERPGSFYICGMALFPEYRGEGLGTGMLELARQQAYERGLEELSLIVFEQNTGATPVLARVEPSFRGRRRAGRSQRLRPVRSKR